MPPPSTRDAIHALLHPRSIAVVGATESPGYGSRLMANLASTNFSGRVVPVNPNRSTVFGLLAVPSIADAPEPVDLAAVVIPAPAVPRTLSEAGARGVPAALVISAGFAETEGQGAALQDVIAGVAAMHGPRICGPNCLGVANIPDRIWVSGNVLAPVDERLRPGGVAIVSQSGATAFGPLLSIARDRAIGLRYVVSSGNEADLTTADFVDYFVADRGVSAIALVLEGIRDGAAFRRAVEGALAADKPIVVLKLGRTPAGAAAARTHTAAMTGADDVFDALVHQYGLARVDDWDGLLETADAFAKTRGKRVDGRRVGVVSHSGGIGGLVADACESRGLTVPLFEPTTEAGLAAILEGRGAARNPADVTGHYDRETFADILRLVGDDPNVDALAIATAGGAHVAQRIAEAAGRRDKPLVACWTGGMEETDGLRALREAGVPIVHEPGDSAAVLAALASWAETRERIEQPPARGRDPRAWAKAGDAARRHGGDHLPEHVGLAMLADAGVPAVRTASLALRPDGGAPSATDVASAVRAAGLAYPLALKVDSPDLPHKSEVGGVHLGLADDAAAAAAAAEMLATVRAARPEARLRGVVLEEMAGDGVEVLLGLHADPQLGPAVMLGLGGVLTEALRARAWRLLPLRPDDANALIDEVPGLARLLAGPRGRPRADRAALRDALLAFAGWADDLAESLASAEVNPLIVLPEGDGVLAVDCLIVPKRVDT